ncbi:MAG: HlyD family efflux transporter periplasmic adaptor subunit [Rhodocyclales bacterium]|nr:HlyD family efflux transporter periplasmic adaptor subunit [Rhodocyclales bacterium]
MKQPRFAVVVAVALLGLVAGRASAHGDEDHSQDRQPAAAAVPAATGATAAEAVSAQRLPDGSLFVPKAVQRQLGLRHVVSEITELAATVEFNGKVIADPNAGGRIQATQSGRVEPGPEGLPTLGQRVAKGQVIAFLRPTADSIERGNQQDRFAELDAQYAIAKRKLARYEQLEGAVPHKEIEAARLEAEALKKRRAAVGASFDASEPLRAPVDGTIAAANVVAGQVVEAKEVLFEVVDPARLAVEALAYDPALVDGIGEASAPLPGGSLQLRFVGGGRLLREQAIPLLFRVAARDAPIAVGQPLKVIARTSRTIKGAAVPQSALVKNGMGETVVWVHIEAERFAPRKVSFQPLDAATVAVTSGLHDRDRVVTDGASLLAQVR